MASVPSLISFVLDHGLDVSTLLHSNKVYTKDGKSGYPLYKCDWPQEVQPQDYYHDTGLFPCEQTLLEFACCCVTLSPYLEETIDLLLTRGGINPGDIEGYVSILKNLCSSRYGSWGDDPNESLRLHYVRKICSHLAATVEWHNLRPKLPVSLFFICLDRCQRAILDELLNVFELPGWDCSKEELWGFLLVLTRNRDVTLLYGPDPETIINTISRRFSYLELIFKADKNNYLLQHEETFLRLYTTVLQVKGGEQAILDYLDRGGRYFLDDGRNRTPLFEACATNSLQLAERLIDMGAHPHNLVSLDKPRNSRDEHGDLWEKNPGDVAMLRLLIERGADPFSAKDVKSMPTDDFYYSFIMYMEGSGSSSPEFFRTLCELTISNKTDVGFLFDLLEIACTDGNLEGVQVLRSCARRRVDAIIRDKAAFFLQTLLAELTHHSCYVCGTYCSCCYIMEKLVKEMDDAIGLIKLILELGPARTLTSRWRLKIFRGEALTALKLLGKLLTPPESPHPEGGKKAPEGGYRGPDGLINWPCDQIGARYRYRVSRCLNERIKIDTTNRKPNITIADKTITLPSQQDLHGVGSEGTNIEINRHSFAVGLLLRGEG